MSSVRIQFENLSLKKQNKKNYLRVVSSNHPFAAVLLVTLPALPALSARVYYASNADAVANLITRKSKLAMWLPTLVIVSNVLVR